MRRKAKQVVLHLVPPIVDREAASATTEFSPCPTGGQVVASSFATAADDVCPSHHSGAPHGKRCEDFLYWYRAPPPARRRRGAPDASRQQIRCCPRSWQTCWTATTNAAPSGETPGANTSPLNAPPRPPTNASSVTAATVVSVTMAGRARQPQAIRLCLRLRLTHDAPWFALRSMSCLGGLVRRRRAGTGIGIGDDIVNSIFDRF